MDRDFLRLVFQNVIPRRLDAIWQFLVVAGALLLYVESASWAEGRVFELVRVSVLAFFIIFQNYIAGWLDGRRLDRTRTRIKSIQTKAGEDTAAMWRAISHVIKPDLWTAMQQVLVIFLAATLYDRYGVLNYSDTLGHYDWLIWLFVGWVAMHSRLRESIFEKIENTYYRQMYFASTSLSDEGTQTHSHA